ncbi:sensor histidine kinase [uncultured Oscillibacter sp.]|uniref:sensor histidine kinase n=1 Tax=uncultured Oscillibacter sp. TaxID=876091 RepID=UPI0025EB8401|nr:GHKL domain-containing protein [uncultured Oscillibacter sp.]
MAWIKLFALELLQNWGWLLANMANGTVLYGLFVRFFQVKPFWGWKALLWLTFSGASGMVIWVGDNNLLYTMPVFFAACLLATQGDWRGRLVASAVFFCLTMSICAMLDTYLKALNYYHQMTRLCRPLVFGGLYLLLRRWLPEEPAALPGRLWGLLLGLAAMPLCALVTVVLLAGEMYHTSPEVQALAASQGLAVLPFVLLTSLVLLAAIEVLQNHERLERASQLADMREVYYQGLRREERQVRQLRHDLRNHLTAVRGLLARGETDRALEYLDGMAGSPALGGGRRLCENDAANAVLAAKAEDLAREGAVADFAVSLPRELAVADADLCALLGNALDNALEAVRQAADKRVVLRCRADKGLFMLRVENALAGPVAPDLATTKTDRTAHGFGLPGMREIAGRYGGTLEAGPRNGRFEVVVCLPLPREAQPPRDKAEP